MEPLALRAAGLVSSLGFDADATAAAVWCELRHVTRTRFLDADGRRIPGCVAPLEQPWDGLDRLVRLIAPPIGECLATAPTLKPAQVPLILCVAERSRHGRMPKLEDLLTLVPRALKVHFHQASTIVEDGRLGIGTALQTAVRLIADARRPACLIAGVDSWLWGPSLEASLAEGRFTDEDHLYAAFPGEGGAAILVSALTSQDTDALACLGLGMGMEPSSEEEGLARSAGLIEAIQEALYDAGCLLSQIDYRLADLGENARLLKSARRAIDRIVPDLDQQLPIWTPAQFLGDIGAATGPALLALASVATRRGYTPGPRALCHIGDRLGRRVAMVVGGGG
jgi:3-oxoacyl-[acyl-carrier-protein] synthase-1